jgi:hypothetical protein
VTSEEDERRVPSPAPQPSFGTYTATQDIPQVTVQDSQRLSSELSPVQGKIERLALTVF